MALDTLILALLLGASAGAPQAHAAPQTHAAPAKPEAKPEPKPATKAESKPEAKADQKAHTATPSSPAPAAAGAHAAETKAGHAAEAKAVPATAATPADPKKAADPKTADAKAEARAASKGHEPSGGKGDLAKLVADLTAVREAAATARAIQTTSRPRSARRAAAARPPMPRYQLQWPSFDERWRVTWPMYSPDRLALVWPE